MRIGLFTDTFSPYISGVCTSIETLKKALEKKGHEVYVVTISMDGVRSYDKKNKVLRVSGMELGIYKDVKVSNIYPLFALKKILKWKLDIIHSHTEGSIGIFARLVSKQYKIPLVHTYHTMYEEYVSLFTKGRFDRITKNIMKHLVEIYCDKSLSELIVPSKKTYDLFKGRYELQRNINIIPTGIDIKKFNKNNFKKFEIEQLKKEVGLDKKDFVLLVISRISVEKNIDFIIYNHRFINKKYPNVKLLIIGDGPLLETLKQKHIKNENIIFLGKVLWDKIPIYYQLGDIFVTASKTETQGLTVNEALSASIPVVCIEDESFKNSVIEDFNGYYFNNKKEYRNKILKLIEDRTLYKKISNQAEEHSVNFSEEKFAEEILKIYKKVLKEKKTNFFDKIKKIIKR